MKERSMIAESLVARVVAGGKKEEYMKFFQEKLKEHNVSSPAELDDAGKKKFFDEIDAEWKGEDETD